MRLTTLFRKAFLSLLLMAAFYSANSQGPAFVCDGKFLISHGNAATTGSQTLMETVTFPSPGVVTVVNLPLSSTTTGFNGIGLNPADGYIYGFQYPNGTTRVAVVKIGSTGTLVNLGEAGTGGGNLQDNEFVYASSFRKDGLFYFVTDDNDLFSITTAELNGARNPTFIATLSGAGVNTPPSNGMADIGIDPINGDIYAVSTNAAAPASAASALFKINPATGATTRVGVYNLPGSFIAGLFFTENGTLYGYGSNGTFQLFNKATAAFTLVGNPPVYNFADGCSCVFRIAHDLNAPLQVCPSIPNPNPVFNFTITVTNNYLAVTGATYSLTLDNRYSFPQTTAQILTAFSAGGLTATAATITSTGGGTNNVLNVTGISIPYVAPSSTNTVVIQGKLSNFINPLIPANFQSVIGGLPITLGTTDASNDPKTSPPDDATTITMCPNITLPVNLVSFTGVYRNNAAQLNWISENETNFAYYEVERSENGSDFFAVNLSAARNTSNGSEQYLYADDLSVNNGTVFYYRLKMVDKDGKFKYSNIIVIRKGEKGIKGITINPNPVIGTDYVTARMTATVNGIADLKIMDMSGRVMIQQQTRVLEGNNNITISSLNKLQAGNYFLQISSGGEVSTAKFTIAR